LQYAITLAARFHDLGKKREIWQRSIGNPNPADWHAKSGKDPQTNKWWVPRDICPGYRHESGSVLDVLHGGNGSPLPKELANLPEETQDLVLHLIAAHHGYARPHFPPENAYDWAHSTAATSDLAAAVPRRFARLQRKYGRWGLAYLESLLRAADYAASANPSADGGDKR
jgi:CRISPR-associated endonuclease/helicase Cas3